MDEAEKTVDKILAKCKAGIYNTTVAKNTIIMVDNINLLGIDEYNIDEVIDDFMNDDKIKVSIDAMTNTYGFPIIVIFVPYVGSNMDYIHAGTSSRIC